MRLNIITIALLLLTSCGAQKVELGDTCLSNLDLSFFRGIYPDIYVNEVYQVLGAPDEKFEIDDYDEPSINLAYYNAQGRLLLNWSGDKKYPIGMIEFRPKDKISLDEVIKEVIDVQNDELRFDCHGEYKVYIYLNDDKTSIKEIHWWNK